MPALVLCEYWAAEDRVKRVGIGAIYVLAALGRRFGVRRCRGRPTRVLSESQFLRLRETGNGFAERIRTSTLTARRTSDAGSSGIYRSNSGIGRGKVAAPVLEAVAEQPRAVDGWGSRQVEEHIDLKGGGGRQHARTHSGRAASRRAGQRLIPAVILVRRQYQNGCNPFVPVRAAHKRGSGKAEVARRSDRDGGADRASETVGGGGLATRKNR